MRPPRNAAARLQTGPAGLPAGLLLAAMLCCWLAAACGKPPPEMTHDAYVWQRTWTPALRDALQAAAPAIRQWRVLAAETAADGSFHGIDIDAAALRATGKGVIAVFRINGGLPIPQQTAAFMLQTLDAWRAAGLTLAGLEIDYDCPTGKLAAYTRFLAGLKPQINRQDLQLDITALPAWLEADALAALLAQTDAAVLQTHAVLNPRQGLFHAGQSLAWAEQFAALSPVPFHMALPDYGTRVVWDAGRRMVGVESESPDTLDGAYAEELWAQPEQATLVLAALRRRPPRNFAGIAWFRLPVAGDRRAWSLSTWLAVINGRSLKADIGLQAVANPSGSFDIHIVNQGAIDGVAPPRLSVAAQHGACTLADGLPPYHAVLDHATIIFSSDQPVRLRAGQRITAGWAVCRNAGLHAPPP